jgi:phospholipid-binding lipoprotein MlaA
MSKALLSILIFIALSIGCARNVSLQNQKLNPDNSSVGQASSQSDRDQPSNPGAVLANAKLNPAPETNSSDPAKDDISDAYSENYEQEDYADYKQDVNQDKFRIADPFEPFNRAMFTFNDRLYFWVLKPVATGYKKILPESARMSVKNFFSNLAFPVRFANCLLQANLKGAVSELGRFTLNTLVGFGGLFDPASEKEISLKKCDEDFGQTLGVYGIGPGFYINWPIFGPSSPRDTIGMVADGFLNPFVYMDPWYTSAGAKTVDTINDTSFRIGDYESIRDAAIDPYVALRDGYVQYRYHKVKSRGGDQSARKGQNQSIKPQQ